MSTRHASLSRKTSGPLDVTPTPLSIRTLDRRKPHPRPIVERVRGEFAEMRGFSPTLVQAARLFDLSIEECDRVLGMLVQDGSIHKGEDGRYRLR